MDDPWTPAAGAVMSYQVGTQVEVKFPLAADSSGNRAEWPWLPGWIAEVCGPDEWLVVVQDPALGLMESGSVPPPGTPEEDLLYPACFRDSSELRGRS